MNWQKHKEIYHAKEPSSLEIIGVQTREDAKIFREQHKGYILLKQAGYKGP